MLPIFQSEVKDLSMLQTRWASLINPVLDNPLAKANFLHNVTLETGNNNINHKLGRKLQGWIITRFQSAFAQIYDNQNTNQMTDLTLVLNASGPVTIDLMVF